MSQPCSQGDGTLQQRPALTEGEGRVLRGAGRRGWAQAARWGSCPGLRGARPSKDTAELWLNRQGPRMMTWACGGPGSTGEKGLVRRARRERGGGGGLPPVTVTTAAGPAAGSYLARSGAAPLPRSGSSRESGAGEEARARPAVGGDGQDGVGERAGQEVGPVSGGLRRQAG